MFVILEWHEAHANPWVELVIGPFTTEEAAEQYLTKNGFEFDEEECEWCKYKKGENRIEAKATIDPLTTPN